MDRARPLAWLDGQWIEQGLFLERVAALAERLPGRRSLIPLCEDRFNFMVGFAAAILRGQPLLLPPDRSAWTLEWVTRRYPDSALLVDPGHAPSVPAGATLLELSGARSRAHPADIPDDRIAAIPFTSGSTGEPQPHPKTWAHLRQSARLIAGALGGVANASMISTVPAQHMYGLELGILLPLFEGARLIASKPFFPQDLRDLLTRIGTPPLLVTTPIHLRALLKAEIDWPRVRRLVSATAPLPRDLAVEAEARFSAPLVEIYGCTEGGSLASRQPVRERVWTWFDGVGLSPGPGGESVIEADYLPGPIPLNDLIEVCGDRQFILRGRRADLINIAGKRSSLAALNGALMGVEGVEDGAFFLPEETGARAVRPILFVVAAEAVLATLPEQLRQRLDPVFLPRVIQPVARLPRLATGKLPRSALVALARHWGLIDESS